MEKEYDAIKEARKHPMYKYHYYSMRIRLIISEWLYKFADWLVE